MKRENKLVRPVHILADDAEKRHKFRDQLEKQLPKWKEMLPNPDEAYKKFKECTLNAFDDVVGKKIIKNINKNMPITKACLEIVNNEKD